MKSGLWRNTMDKALLFLRAAAGLCMLPRANNETGGPGP